MPGDLEPVEPIIIPPPEVEFPGQVVYRSYTGNQTFSGDLHDPSNVDNVRNLVKGIVGTEAPLLFDTLCSKIIFSWGLKRAGNRIREVIRNAVEQNGFQVRRSGTREFIWTKTLAENPYNVFRVPDDNDPRARTAVEICPEEIANAAAHILTWHISMDQDDLM